jgi:hypothetical protein
MKPMKSTLLAALVGALLLAPSAAMACRSYEPEDIKDEPADAIVLARIKDVQKTGEKNVFPHWGPEWVATASVEAPIMGTVGEDEIIFSQRGPGECARISEPRIGKYYVLYLRKYDGKYYPQAMPYWWAWRSGDPRVAKLKQLLPLGPVRAPTDEEMKLVGPAEARVKWPSGKPDDFTRIYARASAKWVAVIFFHSRTPKRLMVDGSEEFPTRESCGCRLYQQTIDLDDLEKAGELPPFNP